MATRNEWNTYRLDDGLNIWGDPEFQGIPVFAGGLGLGDAVTDTLVLNGRTATGSLDGVALDIDATYTYDALEEIRADVSDWTGIGGTDFYGRYSRISASVDSAANNLYGEQIYAANALPGGAGVNVGMMEAAIFNTMGKGGSTITLMRGIEVKCEWLADDVVTNAVGIVIEFMGLAAPTNDIIGLKFEKASAAGAMVAKFHEIQMKEGNHILSGNGTPSGAVTAPQGSLFLRRDCADADTCAYVNTDGADTWTAIIST